MPSAGITSYKPTSRYLFWSRHGVGLDSEAFGQNELKQEFVGSNYASATNKFFFEKKEDSFRIAVIREASVMGDFMSPRRFPNIGSAPS
jgi:hypothetical protein